MICKYLLSKEWEQIGRKIGILIGRIIIFLNVTDCVKISRKM